MGKRQQGGWQHASESFPTRFMFCPAENEIGNSNK